MRLQLDACEITPCKRRRQIAYQQFWHGTRGFAAPQDPTTAVCVLPGTELAFCAPISVYGESAPTPHRTAIFRQINRAQPHMHHDALELPDGRTLLLTFLCEGQEATVLQLPAKPADNPKRARRSVWRSRAETRRVGKGAEHRSESNKGLLRRRATRSRT